MKKKVLWVSCGIAFVFISALVVHLLYMAHMERTLSELKVDSQQTLIIGGAQITPGTKTTVRVMVSDHGTSEPIPEALVKASLKSSKTQGITLASSKTDSSGNAYITFECPSVPEGKYELQIESSSNIGKDKENISVVIKKEPKILLGTDKPLYQPGQIIHIRTLTMEKFYLKPLKGEKITVEVCDPKNNKVFKKSLDTSVFGLASCDFTLATEVNEGAYRIKAILGKTTVEKEITVKRYVLPKFKITSQFDQGYYMPGQTVKGSISAQYFFGKPVAGSKVKLTASTFDVAFKEWLSLEGTTNRDGWYAFEFKLPDSLYGSELQKGDALVKLDFKVIDQAEHSEQITQNLTISGTPIHIVAVPESPCIAIGIPNTVYICTYYPNGTPAKTELTINNEKLSTNSLGIAEFKLTPSASSFTLGVTAKDEQGLHAGKDIQIQSSEVTDFFMVLDKATYKAGDVVSIKVISNRKSGNFYLDIIKERQTVLTSILEIKEGKCETTFTLPHDISGTLLANLYKISQDSSIRRDTRLIFVAPPEELSIGVSLDKDTYRPGEKAQISFDVKDTKGEPKDSGLSIAIVDESVFSLQEMQPGLEKVYFMLQKELMKPRYQIRYAPPVADAEIVSLPVGQKADKAVTDEKDQATRVMFAMAKAQSEQTSLNSYTYKVNRIQNARMEVGHRISEYIDTLHELLLTALFCAPFVIGILACIGVISATIWKWKKHKGEHYDPADMSLQSKRICLMKSRFSYHMFLIFPLVLSLSLFLISLFNDRDIEIFLITLIPPVFFAFLFSLIRQENGVRMDKGFFITGAIVALAAICIMKFHVQSTHWWHYREKLLFVLLAIFGIGMVRHLASLVWYGVKYLRQRDRLSGSGYAVVLPFVFVTMLTLGFLATLLIEESYGIRYSLHREMFGSMAFYCIFISVVAFPLFTSYISGFLKPAVKTKWRFAYSAWVIVVILLLAALLLPSLSSSGGRAKWGVNPTVMRAPQNEFWAMNLGGERDDARMVENGRALQAPGVMETKGSVSRTGDKIGATKNVRIREYFPETLYWNPELIAKQGKAQIEVPVSDSITTFRMTCQGVAEDGSLGSITKGLRVFQDFFVDIDFPVSLTQYDEVSVPVQIYNYLPHPQKVRLVVQPENWFELLDSAEKERSLDTGQVSVVYFRLKATRVGQRKLTIMAYGEKMDDAVRRSVTIEPFGQKVEEIINDRLAKSVEHKITIPETAVPEASKIIVKCYPGLESVLVEGLDGMLQLPSG